MNYNFTSLSNQLVANIQQISTNVNSLQKLVNQLGSDDDNNNLRQELQSVQHKTNELAKQCNTDIQQLSRLIPISDTIQHKENKILCERIRSDFLNILKNFQEIQRNAAQNVRQFVVKQTKHEIKPNNPFYANEEYDFESTTLSFKEEPIIQNQIEMNGLDEERQRLEMAEQQNQAVRQLESDIIDVNQIFQDLSKMVSEQQDVIDNIETNVQTANIEVEEGNQRLRSAAEYQMKARKKRLIIVIIFAIIIFVLTLIIYFSVNH